MDQHTDMRLDIDHMSYEVIMELYLLQSYTLQMCLGGHFLV